MKRSIGELANFLGCNVAGERDVEITGVASIECAAAGDLVFAGDQKKLAAAFQSRASAIVGDISVPSTSPSKPVLLCDAPKLAFARAAEFILAVERPGGGVHPTAVIHSSVALGEQVRVEAHASIEPAVVVGDGTRIGAGSRIGEGVRIGQNCNLGCNVTIYPGATLGNRVIVHAGAVLGSDGFGYVRDSKTGRYTKFPQIGRLEIEDDVEIGANATIDRGALDATRIARGTKIDNLVHVGHNVQIGEDVVIAAQTGLSGSAVLENGVVVGGQVGVADHVRIESGAILGAQCGVPTKKVIRGKGIVFWGTPARPIREYLKELAALAKLGKRS